MPRAGLSMHCSALRGASRVTSTASLGGLRRQNSCSAPPGRRPWRPCNILHCTCMPIQKQPVSRTSMDRDPPHRRLADKWVNAAACASTRRGAPPHILCAYAQPMVLRASRPGLRMRTAMAGGCGSHLMHFPVVFWQTSQPLGHCMQAGDSAAQGAIALLFPQL